MDDGKRQHELASIRDTVESIGVAIVLAFVLRAFLIEAFVIPTGSMAPRLMGEHFDLRCPACGYEYAFGEAHQAAGPPARRARKTLPRDAVCPNCGFPYVRSAEAHGHASNSGDRVLVLKYPYRLPWLDLAQARPWDVVVFRNPQNNRENYIKRLIGLPGETIEIVHGNLFVLSSATATDGAIRRKPKRAQDAMWQVVFDNDYRPDPEKLREAKIAPPAWVPADNSGAWDVHADHGRWFLFRGSREPAQLVFRPGYDRADVDRAVRDGQARPKAIEQSQREAFLPHYGYNARTPEAQALSNEHVDVCSDLKLGFTFIPEARDSTVTGTLTSFEFRFQGEVRADGTAVLRYRAPGGRWQEWDRQKVEPMELGRSYDVALTHVDFRVALWVDEERVCSNRDGQYPMDYLWLHKRLKMVASRPIPTPEVRIAASGGGCVLRHVKVLRDVYYTSPPYLRMVEAGPLGRYAREEGIEADRSPTWGTTGHPITLRKHDDDPDLDEFFMLGDNSPQSLDGRSWTSAAPTLRLYKDRKANHQAPDNRTYQLGTVPRYCLIGRAFFVYWPAGFRLPGLEGLPILPNVGRMRLIR